MRHIDRLPEPEILKEKHDKWQKQYEKKLEEKPDARPDSSKYAHRQIIDTLYSMSHGKCFYCETKLSGDYKEVDHCIEVSLNHSKAYCWENLYLACLNCNRKLDNNAIAVTTVLDPCHHSDKEIRMHLTFIDEQISAANGSKIGLNTIKKYRLNTDLLDMRRSKWLNRILKVVTSIQSDMLEDGRNKPTREEQKQLLMFISPDQPFSLMSEIYIRTYFPRLIE